MKRLPAILVIVSAAIVHSAGATPTANPAYADTNDESDARGSDNGSGGDESAKRVRIKELEGLIGKARESVKEACGCSPGVAGHWKSFADVNKMYRCHDTIDAIAASAKDYCSSDEAKKVYCAKVSSYSIKFTTERYEQPKIDGKKVTTYCTDMKYTNADELKEVFKEL